MTHFLDEDGSGEVDLNEFTNKITFKDYQKRSHEYLISEMQFIQHILN